MKKSNCENHGRKCIIIIWRCNSLLNANQQLISCEDLTIPWLYLCVIINSILRVISNIFLFNSVQIDIGYVQVSLFP